MKQVCKELPDKLWLIGLFLETMYESGLRIIDTTYFNPTKIVIDAK